ncbi:3-deoxy-7-phosphoheptulonate synthase [Streptomyces eurythermus]|uniref:3-deoxy-7-phosphoheptulonate synthase n=1 Tax=Streptomyces eurythermus TaxID=42237 RepID=UPI0036D210B0
MRTRDPARREARFTRPLPEGETERWLRLPALQQPRWENPERAGECRRLLTGLRGLVTGSEVRRLQEVLARCALGKLHVVQVGDCAEDPDESDPQAVRRTVGLIDALAGVWQMSTGTPAVRVGRMAGQYAKPRSRPVEKVGGRTLPVYRGHMVNRPGPHEADRRHLPDHMLHCYEAAARVVGELTRLGDQAQPAVWTSHEALVLDYELSLIRCDTAGRRLLTSTHWPWIGDRTRDPAHAHVRLLASVVNPVACKVGPTATPEEVLELCAALDPARQPGRLTLISRMGAEAVDERLPPLVEAVRAAGHPVIWLCDPMHANTRRIHGIKTRHLREITAELRRFHHCVSAAGGIPGGVHLETTAADVAECTDGDTDPVCRPGGYQSLCDPRLNPRQALAVLTAVRDTVPGPAPER